MSNSWRPGRGLLWLMVLIALVGIGYFVYQTVLAKDTFGPGELVVYSSRNENFVRPLVERFEQETGIRVRLLSGNEALVNKLIEERTNVQADVYISNDAGQLEYLRLAEVLAANDSAKVAAVPGMYRAEDGAWVGLSARTRVLMYNRDLITEEEMPKTLWELADPKWQGRFMITRGGNGSMVAHVAALRAHWGDAKTLEWLTAVRANAGAVVNGHGDIRRAVGGGEFAFGLVNNYYFHQQLREPTNNNVAAVYPDQEAGGMGAFVNAAGVALLRSGPNPVNGRTFLDWVLAPEHIAEFISVSLEVPLNPAVAAAPEARPIDTYLVMDLSLRQLGPVWADVRQLIEQAGLDLNL